MRLALASLACLLACSPDRPRPEPEPEPPGALEVSSDGGSTHDAGVMDELDGGPPAACWDEQATCEAMSQARCVSDEEACAEDPRSCADERRRCETRGRVLCKQARCVVPACACEDDECRDPCALLADDRLASCVGDACARVWEQERAACADDPCAHLE